jgi:release factor glutamine methyltransferase
MTYQAFLNKQMKRADSLGKEREAIKLLVLELSGLDGANFFLKLTEELPVEDEKRFLTAIDKYLIDGIPVQHILGYSYFYGYRMIVNKEVLIPRPETEELVGYVLQKYDDVFDGQKVDVVDVGTGSGAVAVALVKEEPNMSVSATDISETALEVAVQNAKNNDANVTFYLGDMLQPLIERNLKFDILVSNPPYIPEDEYVESIVKDNEPHVALFGGVDGMYFYDIILSNASKILKDINIIAFEHSYNKGEQMIALAKKYFPEGKVELIKDLNGKDRFTIIVNGK